MNNKKKGKQQQQQKSLQFSKFFFETKQTNQPADSANIKRFFLLLFCFQLHFEKIFEILFFISILNFFHEEEMAIDNSWEISPVCSGEIFF